MQQLEFTLPFFSRLLIANEHGLGMSELAALAVIGLCNEARVNQIADAAKMTPKSAYRAIHSLSAKGLVVCSQVQMLPCGGKPAHFYQLAPGVLKQKGEPA